MQAKFVCQHVEDLMQDKWEEKDGKFVKVDPPVREKYAERISFSAVCPPYQANDPKTHPNYAWWKATPSGHLEMQIDNPSAFGHFEAGKEYFLTFTLADY